MEQNRITIDAHTLVWHLHEPSRKFLSTEALKAIMLAEDEGIIYVPSVVLLEILRLIEKGKFPLSFNHLLSWIEQSGVYKLIPLDNRLLEFVSDVSDRLELHDRVIVATAIITDTFLVSADIMVSRIYSRVIW
jgi:PIN domain nuclease of toxin-antitoxin system